MTDPSLPHWQRFLVTSICPALSCLLTNPLEVAKIRNQMDGELRRTTSGLYKGTLHTLNTIYRHEGLRGLQAGLAIAVFREGTKNIFRLGFYSPILSFVHDTKDGSVAPIYKRLFAGATSGAIAALICNPVELAKTRLQAEACTALTVRPQFGYTGMADCFRRMYYEEGLIGMWKGTTVSMLRSATVTSVNLTMYTKLREYMLKRAYPDTSAYHCLCSFIAAFGAVLANNPLDVMRSRLYNQKAHLYDNAWDCVRKVTRSEGFAAWYKGFWNHFFRVGPHYVITFALIEQMQRFLAQTNTRNDK